MNTPPNADFELIPLSATYEIRKNYQRKLRKLELDELRYISGMLGKSEEEPKKETIESILLALSAKPTMTLSRLAESHRSSIEIQNILSEIIPIMELEEAYENNEMGNNMAVKIKRDGDGHAFELCKMHECQPLAWPYTSSQDRRPGRACVTPASHVAEVSTLTVDIDKHSRLVPKG